jgi:hypothetical protein
MNKKIFIYQIIIYSFFKKTTNNLSGNIKSSTFKRFVNIDIENLNPIYTALVKHSPDQCASNCNRNNLCDAFTTEQSSSNENLTSCKLYSVLRDNKCVANLTKISKYGTQFYQKSRKGINATCRLTKECTSDYKLECIRSKCSCNST